MKKEAFYKKYNHKMIDDWGAYTSDEFKQMARDFKNVLRDEFKKDEFEIKEFTPAGHYFFSGFVKRTTDNKCVYISYDCNRGIPFGGIPVTLDDKDCMNGFLVRLAKNEKDYGGAHSFNHFTNFYGIKDLTLKLMNEEIPSWERK